MEDEAVKSCDSKTADSESNSNTDDLVKADSSNAATNQKDSADDDDELNALLDSALSDFDKPLKPCTKPKQNFSESKEVSTSAQQSLPPNPSGSTTSAADNEHPWGSEFVQFENALQSFLAEDPQLKEQWDRLTESANKAANATSDEEFASSLADTLKGLAQNAQAISQNATDDDVSQLLGSMIGLDDLGSPSDMNGALPDLLPLMQNVMQNLLSKDLLYPALKDMVDKYPGWLADKRPNLKQEEYERYTRQLGLMKEVCNEFEEEKPDDPDDVKKARFERVVVIMQKMQDCGNPPKELLGDMGDLEFDENGRLKIPELSESQCSIM